MCLKGVWQRNPSKSMKWTLPHMNESSGWHPWLPVCACFRPIYPNICKEKSTTNFMSVITWKYLSTHCIKTLQDIVCGFTLKFTSIKTMCMCSKNKKILIALLTHATSYTAVMCLVMQEKENSLNKLFKKKMDFYMHECTRFSSHYIAYLSKIAFFVAVFFFATKADWEQFNFHVNSTRTVSTSLCRVSMQLLTITPSCDAVCNKNRQRCDDTKDVCKFTVEKRKKKKIFSVSMGLKMTTEMKDDWCFKKLLY